MTGRLQRDKEKSFETQTAVQKVLADYSASIRDTHKGVSDILTRVRVGIEMNNNDILHLIQLISISQK